MKSLFSFFIFAALSLVLGLGSAHYLIEHGFALVITQAGPWKAWTHAGGLGADPYTRAHIARTGQLPITSASGLTFVATTDNSDAALTSDCEYEIVAQPLPAVWWTVAVYDEYGKLIPNKAQRYAFSSQNLATLPDGTQRISLSPTARPGNWLPSGDGGSLTLVLRIIRPLTVEQQQTNEALASQQLPRIRRIGC